MLVSLVITLGALTGVIILISFLLLSLEEIHDENKRNSKLGELGIRILFTTPIILGLITFLVGLNFQMRSFTGGALLLIIVGIHLVIWGLVVSIRGVRF